VVERLNDAGRQAVLAAQEEARGLHHPHVGTEHLLLGVLHDGEGPAARALAGLGITLGTARADVMRALGLPAQASPERLALTTGAEEALARALREAIELGSTEIGPEHILLAIMRERYGVALRVLVARGADVRRIREALNGALRTANGPAPPPPAPDAGHAESALYALLGILASGGPAASLLRAHGVDEAAVQRLLRSDAPAAATAAGRRGRA
jgi:ATP-dependent Clp protease ATP-binding subunit ClpC